MFILGDLILFSGFMGIPGARISTDFFQIPVGNRVFYSFKLGVGVRPPNHGVDLPIDADFIPRDEFGSGISVRVSEFLVATGDACCWQWFFLHSLTSVRLSQSAQRKAIESWKVVVLDLLLTRKIKTLFLPVQPQNGQG